MVFAGRNDSRARENLRRRDGLRAECGDFSSDLSLGLIQPAGNSTLAEPPLSPPLQEGEEEEKTLYERHNEAGCAPVHSSCYVALVTATNDRGKINGERSRFGGTEGMDHSGLTLRGASADAHHVVFSSGSQAPTAPLTEGAYAEGENLYEWNAEEPALLKHLNLLPGTELAATNPSLGGGASKVTRNAVSEDGSHVIFSANQHLYLRGTLTGHEETLQLDQLTGVPETKSGDSVYQGASDDGKRVFFYDGEPLVPGSRAERASPHLFEWEQTSEPGQPLGGTLRDLTNPPTGAPKLEGIVAAISDDGAKVYFVAGAVLATNANAEKETATPGACRSSGPEPLQICNLYVDSLEAGAWHTTFIARLSEEDAPDFGNRSAVRLEEVTAGDSPDGEYFAFMSKRPLIRGYDNQVANPEADGARAEEVYLFNDSDSSLTCVSCDPNGARPTGVRDTEEAGEGLGLLIDRKADWGSEAANPRWLAGSLPAWEAVPGSSSASGEARYRPRYLSNQGRLFFNSPEPLVPADENAKSDVYEYERDGIGSCALSGGCVSLMSSGTSAHESAFLDASAEGEDVFFLTDATLVPADQNGIYDVYDARVCTTEAPCIESNDTTPEGCDSRETCADSPPTSAPAITVAPTTATGPSGNVSSASPPSKAVLGTHTVKPSRAELLKKALKRCKRFKRKQKRQACERLARKTYGKKAEKKR